MIGALTQGRRSLVPPAAALVFLGGLMIAVWLSGQIASGNFRDLLMVIVPLQAVWLLTNWRLGVYIFVVYVAVEGFIVNFFHSIPELNLLKDFLALTLFVVLLIYTASQKTMPIPRASWLAPFAGFCAIYVCQVFNPSLPNILVGLIGIRATLLFFVLMPVGYWFFESKARVWEFFQFFLWLSVPISLFGVAQFVMGPSWLVSLSPGFSRAVYYAVGSQGLNRDSYFRTFSTFVHTGGFGQFLLLCMLLCVAFWLAPRFRSFRFRLVILFILLTAAMLSTGSRSSLVWFGVSLGLMAVMQMNIKRVIPILLVVPLILWGAALLGGVGFTERYGTLFDLEYVQGRNIPLLVGWLQESMKTDWAGLGAGYASVASRHGGATPLNSSVVENGLAKIRFEAGLPGFVIYLFFVLLLLRDSLTSPLQVRDPEVRSVAIACGAFIFTNVINVVMGTPFDASPTNTLIWFLAGFLARVPHLVEEGTPASVTL